MNNLKSFVVLGAAFLALSACSLAPFPEFDDDDYSLVSDSENATYEGQENKKKVDAPEKAAPAKTKPVIVADDLDDEPKEDVEKTAETKVSIDKAQKLSDAKIQEVKAPARTENTIPSVTYLVATIYFNNGSAAVDSSYNKQLRDIVKLAKSKNATLNVFGYASSRTRNTDIVSHKMANFKVSAERAENVANALRRAGMPASKIKVEALSDSNPAYLEVMPEGERLNRRAEVYISY